MRRAPATGTLTTSRVAGFATIRVRSGRHHGSPTVTAAHTPAVQVASSGCHPGGHASFVALRVGEDPPAGRVLVADELAARGEGGLDARLGLLERHPDVEVDPVAPGARGVHLLEVDAGAAPPGIDELLAGRVGPLLVAEDGPSERQHVSQYPGV